MTKTRQSSLTPGEVQIRAIREARRRRLVALRLKNEGKTYQEIADTLGGMTRQRAMQLVHKARLEG